MLISQIVDDAGHDPASWRARNGGTTRIVNGANSVYALAMEAARSGSRPRRADRAQGLRRDASISTPPTGRAGCCRRSTIPIRRICISPAPA